MRLRISVASTVGFIVLMLPGTAAAQPQADTKESYAPSPVIRSLTIEPGRQSIGDGDNWPITWADDGDLYTVYCDGKGFGGGNGQGSMSLAKIAGTPPNHTGENIASATGHRVGGGHEGRKASGLLMVDGVLGIFDAPTPWGPWAVVKEVPGWGGEENRFQPRIPAKWISPDGLSFWLVYSCFPKGPYQFNLQKCTLTAQP